MRRTPFRAVTAITLAALFAGTATTAAYASPEEVPPLVPAESPTGVYIVVLAEEPVASYDGGEAGLAPTKPDEGEELDTRSTAAKKYSAYLEKRQKEVAAEVGADPRATYQVALNGFSAKLSPEQVGELTASKDVVGVYPEQIFHPDAVSSTQFLGLEGPGGVWEAVGGTDAAGEGVVVGVVDTGIAPEHPSFAGEPLGTTPSDDTPYLVGNNVVFQKADGGTFSSARVTGQQWSNDDYSTKLIGGKYFSTGAAAAGFDFTYDYLSPRDGDGHGSHTASTAAGNNGVSASIAGVDFGAISGVAPAAKIAAYKACFVGPDPLVTDDDICAGSDLLNAIDAAVDDGVDVINFSIGGGTAVSSWEPIDQMFFNAGLAGVFVAVSAGNAGPAPTTADHASPWYTTVAASTIPTYEGTVELADGQQFAGVSVTVPFDGTVTGPAVYSGDAAAAGVPVENARLCFLDSLDPAKVAGKIVVCDRGTNARVEKSQEVADKGGIGMVLVNVTPGSLDNDFHSVPTVHIDAQYRDAVLSYVTGTADPVVTLHPSNLTDVVTPTPQIAGFSSRGPMIAEDGDIIKPDIAAPGVAILAAAHNAEGADPTFEFKSGTSMASPHIAGLAALYLGVHPNATPGEIKSAMMTTAYDTIDASGADVTDPFAQGAGHVDPTPFFDPGLLYLNGPLDWAAYVEGIGGYDWAGVEPIDPSDLNIASIGIGTLAGPQTVTRTLTATRAGSYTAEVDFPGFDVTVEPSTLTFGAAGESQDVSITIARSDAPVDEWSTGFLTWVGADGTTVRSPMAAKPASVDAPDEATGTGITGSTDITVESWLDGEVELGVAGLAPVRLLTDPANEVPGHSGDQNSTGQILWIETIEPGTSLAQWTLDSSDDEGSDLDLYVYRVVGPDDLRYYERFLSATASADEQVTLDNPTAGTYAIVADMYATPNPMTWDLTSAIVGPNGEGSFTGTPNPLPLSFGQEATYTVSWTGLDPDTTYLGVVRYGASPVRTLVTVESGAAAPVAKAAPTIAGAAKVGSTLKAKPGSWKPKDVTFEYQWLRNGEPISGATGTQYKVTSADVGTALSVRVTATEAGNPNVGTAVSKEVFVKNKSRTTVSMNRYLGTSSQNYAVTVGVTAGGGSAEGTVNVWVDTKKYTGTLANGSVTFNLPKQKKGIHVVIAEYVGTDTVEASASISGFIVLK